MELHQIKIKTETQINHRTGWYYAVSVPTKTKETPIYGESNDGLRLDEWGVSKSETTGGVWLFSVLPIPVEVTRNEISELKDLLSRNETIKKMDNSWDFTEEVVQKAINNIYNSYIRFPHLNTGHEKTFFECSNSFKGEDYIIKIHTGCGGQYVVEMFRDNKSLNLQKLNDQEKMVVEAIENEIDLDFRYAIVKKESEIKTVWHEEDTSSPFANL